MTDPPAPAPIGPGLAVGHYMIREPLGKGGMGEVFVGYDTRLDRRVAIKVLPAEFATDSRRLKRFEVEAKALAALNHPNIVSVFSIEEFGARLLLVMELIEGRTLREVIPPSGLALPEFFEIAVSLADAVAAAHARGVMHRDLKPENIMITTSGRVKILDFGLAKFRSGDSSSFKSETRLTTEITADRAPVGTVPYMSPELLDGEPIDSRSDVFALGVVFHEMLTGTQPFRGRTVAQLVTAILRDDPAPMAASRSDLPSGLVDVVSRCLAKKPAIRFDSGVELYSQLRQIARQSDPGLPSSPVPAPWSARDGSVDAPAWRGVDLTTWLGSRWGLAAIIVALLVINWIETNLEELWSVRAGSWVGYDLAQAFSWFERELSFERHDLGGPIAVYGGSIAYFLLPVLLLGLTLAALIPRSTIDGFRIFVLAIAVTYAVSLPFYLLLPIPERWAFPDSHAVLLSDLWSTKLIETVRPISGLDNCFPSFHVAGTFDAVLVWYLLRLRYRHAIGFLGGAIVISTVLLGIHWVADVVAGLALAAVSVRAAVWMNARITATGRSRLGVVAS